MDRLTEKQSEGYDLKALSGQYCNNYCDEQSAATCRDCAIYQAIQKLARYEDLEEAGKLITLPCKRGDTVYYIYMDCPSDYKEVYCIDHQGGCANCHHRVPAIMSKKYTLDDIDMPVYLTEQEAKEALEVSD